VSRNGNRGKWQCGVCQGRFRHDSKTPQRAICGKLMCAGCTRVHRACHSGRCVVVKSSTTQEIHAEGHCD